MRKEKEINKRMMDLKQKLARICIYFTIAESMKRFWHGPIRDGEGGVKACNWGIMWVQQSKQGMFVSFFFELDTD